MNRFECEVWRSLKELSGCYVHRFTDTSAMRYMNSFSLKQPADFLVLYHGFPVVIECKSVKNPRRFECRYVRQSQVESLLAWRDAGGLSYLFICDRSQARKFRCYAISIEDYVMLSDSGSVSSIPWSVLAEYSFLVDRVYPGGWDVQSFIRFLVEGVC